MIVSNVSNTKNKLSDLLKKVQDGEVVTIVDRDKPVARIVRIVPDGEGSRMDRLVAQGIVAPPVASQRFVAKPLDDAEGGSLLDALLAEREEERG